LGLLTNVVQKKKKEHLLDAKIKIFLKNILK